MWQGFVWLFWPVPIIYLLVWAGDRFPRLTDWMMSDSERDL